MVFDKLCHLDAKTRLKYYHVMLIEILVFSLVSKIHS